MAVDYRKTKNMTTANGEYTITPLGVLSLHMPLDVARRAMSALEDRAQRYGGHGIAGIVFNGGGGAFVQLECKKPQNDPKMSYGSGQGGRDV